MKKAYIKPECCCLVLQPLVLMQTSFDVPHTPVMDEDDEAGANRKYHTPIDFDKQW